MTTKFSTLRERMSPSSRQRARERAREMLAEMALAELRKASGMNQTELAKVLGVKQATLSRMENQKDMRLSTLRRIIEALGGKLEITATFPNGRVVLSRE